jgi:uncharacterized protein (TIGR02246 family)
MSPDESAIRDLVAAWVRAAESADYEAVFSLIAEDGVMLIAGLPPFRSRSEYRAFVLAAVRPGRSFKASIDVREIAVHGDWAHVWACEKSEVVREPGAAPVRASGDSLNILRRRPGGGWEVALAANMMAMEGIES